MRYDLLLCGVGGQGILTVSEVVAVAAMNRGLKTIVTQDRGLAQRGGSVRAHVRMGDVHSPMIPKGQAHALLSLESGETLRYLDYLNPDTVVVASSAVIGGPPAALAVQAGPSDEAWQVVGRLAGSALSVDAEGRAAQLGWPRAANLFLLGVLFGLDPRLAALIDPEQLAASIRSVVRRETEESVEAFGSGMRHAQEGR